MRLCWQQKVLIVFGTRPEAIKLAPVIIKLKSIGQFDVKVCVTGQHREMLDSALALFGLLTDYDLSIMKPSQSLGAITTKILLGLESILTQEQPDLAIVHGDTTTP